MRSFVNTHLKGWVFVLRPTNRIAVSRKKFRLVERHAPE